MSRLEELIEQYCPDGVEYRNIDVIFKISRGRVMSKDYLRDNLGEFPVYSSQTQNNGIFGYIDNYDYDFESLTWTTDGANAGSVFYHNNEKFSITNVCGLLKPINTSSTNTRFAYYTLSLVAKQYVNAAMGNPKLMSNVVAKISLPLPPIVVQEEIVRILDTFEEYGLLLNKELLARQKQYEFYRNSLLNFEDLDNHLLKGMLQQYGYDKVEFKGIIDILEQPITDGPHETPKFVDFGIPFISVEAIENGKVNLNKCRGFISKEYDELCARKYKPKLGDVYLVKSASTGKVAIVDIVADFNIWSPIAAMRVNTLNKPKYLYYLLDSKKVQNQILMMANFGSQSNLSMRKIEKITIPVPPLEIQEEIVRILDHFDSLVNDIKIGLPAEIEARQKQFEYYRNKLLTFKEVVS